MKVKRLEAKADDKEEVVAVFAKAFRMIRESGERAWIEAFIQDTKLVLNVTC